MKCNILYIIIFFLVTRSAASQCPERAFVYNRLNTISEGTDELRTISDLRNLAFLCRQCNLADDSTYAKILHVLGRTLWYQNKLDTAIIVTKDAIRVNSLKTAKVSPANLCHSYFNLGCMYSDAGELQLAITYLDRAIGIAGKFPEKTGSIAGAYNKKANIYMSQGDYEKAIAFSDRGYSYAEKTGEKAVMAKSLMEGAQAMIELNDLNRSETALAKSLNLIIKEPNEALKGSIYSLFAELKKRNNQADETISYYKKSFAAFQNDGFDYGCGQAANNLGDYYFQNLSDLPRALVSYKKALEFMPESLGKALIWGNISSVYNKRNEFDLALLYLQKGLLLAPIQFKDKNVVMNPSSHSIRLAVDKGGVLGLVQKKADIWLSFAKKNGKDKEKLGNALKTYMLADTMIDYMRWEHSGNLTKLFWRDKTRSMYENAIETCYLLGDAVTALYFFEKSRAVMLNDQLNELGANQKLGVQEASLEKKIRNKISDLQNRLEETQPDSKDYTRIRNELFQAQEKQQAFIKQLEKANPQYYAYKYDNSVPSLQEIRKNVLPDGQVLISYFVGERSVYALLVSMTEIKLKKINIDDYNLQMPAFQKLLSNRENQNRNFGDYLTVSNRLYKLLLKPFELKANRVIISPDGNFMPFECLTFSPSEPDFLVGRYAFSYTYSAGFLIKILRSKAGFPGTKTFFGMAPETFAPKLVQASLPGSESALKTIKKHFFFSTIVTGKDASREVFLKELSGHRIIQLFTHASADSVHIEPTLYFADSALKLSELQVSGLSKTQLLVLSACRTGVGKNQKGEGVFSLARGFAGIGIPSTLTTLWSVENKASYKLTQLFYEEIVKGIPLDVALQQAQVKWLQNASKMEQLPYSWAGMVVLGSTEAVDTGFSKATIYISVLAVLVLTLAVLWVTRWMSSRRKMDQKLL